MDYQAPAPAAGGRGCYNCKPPNFRLQTRNIRTTTYSALRSNASVNFQRSAVYELELRILERKRCVTAFREPKTFTPRTQVSCPADNRLTRTFATSYCTNKEP
jgi:hypothetical protein